MGMKVMEYRIRKVGGRVPRWIVSITSTEGGVTVKTQSEGDSYDKAVKEAKRKEEERRTEHHQRRDVGTNRDVPLALVGNEATPSLETQDN